MGYTWVTVSPVPPATSLELLLLMFIAAGPIAKANALRQKGNKAFVEGKLPEQIACRDLPALLSCT